MATPLGDIEFLVRSEHRFQILTELTEQSCKRAELQERTGMSRTTVSRSLSEMEKRGWVGSEGWQYELTLLGEMIYKTVSQAIETTATVQNLNQVIEWLPFETMGIDPHQLHDATISVASRNDPTLPAREFGKLKSADDHVRALAYAFDPLQSALRPELDETDQCLEFVFSPSFFTNLQADTGAARHVSEIAASEQGEFYVAEKEPTIQLVMTDGTVGLLLSGDDGTFPAYIESQEESVIDWAAEKFEAYREKATRVTSTDISVGNQKEQEESSIGHAGGQ